MTPETSLGAQVAPRSMLAGRYRLIAPIASGGMAQVWRAEDTVLGRHVAAKILHPHLATDQAFLTRFRREAIAAARLSHRSIVGIYDTVSEVDTTTDTTTEAIIMELIEGRTMRSVLDQTGPMPIADALEIGIQVAEALSEAHRGGVVHRDIKPSNILLCPDRRVMVTDFGIAKAGEDTDLTVTGMLLGTAKYLSPEQVLGDDVDPRSDLYSLGIILYEALAGRPPFRAETDAATALACLHQNPRPLAEFRADLPIELVAIVDRLLARDPAHRFARAIDVRTALAAVQRPDAAGTAGVGPAVGLERTLTIDAPSRSAVEGTDPTAVAPHLSAPRGTPADPTFDEPDDTDDDGFLRSERTWLVPTLVLGFLAGALVLAALLFTRSGGDDDTTPDDTASSNTDTTISLTPVNELVEPAVVSIASVDRPELGGDGTENDDLLPLAFDGDPATAWRSDTYRAPGFGRLKPGVGLLVDLGGTARLDTVGIDSNSDGWAVQLFVGTDFSGPPDTWGAPVADEADLDGSETFEFDEARGTQLLVWIVEPGTSPDRNDDGADDDHRLEIEEITVS